MRLAGDDDPAAADWLWSPVGTSLARQFQAVLTGTHRHTVHLTMLASQSEQFAGIDIQATLKAAEKDTRDLIDMSVAIARTARGHPQRGASCARPPPDRSICPAPR